MYYRVGPAGSAWEEHPRGGRPGGGCSRPAVCVEARACQSVGALLVFGTARTEVAVNVSQKLYGRVAQRKGHPGDSRGVQEEGLGGAQWHFSSSF